MCVCVSFHIRPHGCIHTCAHACRDHLPISDVIPLMPSTFFLFFKDKVSHWLEACSLYQPKGPTCLTFLILESINISLCSAFLMWFQGSDSDISATPSHHLSSNSLPYVSSSRQTAIIILPKFCEIQRDSTQCSYNRTWSHIENLLVLLFRITYKNQCWSNFQSADGKNMSTHFFPFICHNSHFTYRERRTQWQEVTYSRVKEWVGGIAKTNVRIWCHML